jgi:hypothetical protein
MARGGLVVGQPGATGDDSAVKGRPSLSSVFDSSRKVILWLLIRGTGELVPYLSADCKHSEGKITFGFVIDIIRNSA